MEEFTTNDLLNEEIEIITLFMLFIGLKCMRKVICIEKNNINNVDNEHI